MPRQTSAEARRQHQASRTWLRARQVFAAAGHDVRDFGGDSRTQEAVHQALVLEEREAKARGENMRTHSYRALGRAFAAHRDELGIPRYPTKSNTSTYGRSPAAGTSAGDTTQRAERQAAERSAKEARQRVGREAYDQAMRTHGDSMRAHVAMKEAVEAHVRQRQAERSATTPHAPTAKSIAAEHGLRHVESRRAAAQHAVAHTPAEQHALKQGAKGGTYYLTNAGKKVYVR